MHCPSGQSRRQRLPTPRPPLAGPSEFELLQVLTARADGCERIGRLVVLDEVVLDSRLIALREDFLEVDLSRTDLHHAVVRWAGRVLDVHHREPSGPAREVRQRILSARGGPAGRARRAGFGRSSPRTRLLGSRSPRRARWSLRNLFPSGGAPYTAVARYGRACV